ncbi:hypothetical protein N7G274_004574 [Stereocaulon virgatum]|uniref:Uncharacterized protein n=1 Tax=Stereocaulon virgatum TaxID=373712 RepID=A0ABR4AAL7_9LECA
MSLVRPILMHALLSKLPLGELGSIPLLFQYPPSKYHSPKHETRRERRRRVEVGYELHASRGLWLCCVSLETLHETAALVDRGIVVIIDAKSIEVFIHVVAAINS